MHDFLSNIPTSPVTVSPSNMVVQQALGASHSIVHSTAKSLKSLGTIFGAQGVARGVLPRVHYAGVVRGERQHAPDRAHAGAEAGAGAAAGLPQLRRGLPGQQGAYITIAALLNSSQYFWTLESRWIGSNKMQDRQGSRRLCRSAKEHSSWKTECVGGKNIWI